MSVIRRATASTAASLLLAAGLTGCTSDPEDEGAAGGTEVVIGADLASGSAVDTAYARALQLMVGQLNESGRLGDRKLVLRIQDNNSDTTASLRNISTFGDDPSVIAVVTGECGECVVGAAKAINERKVPVISLAATDKVVTPVNDYRYVFKVGPNSLDSAAAMAAELTRTRAERVAVLYSDDLYGRGGYAALVSALEKAGIEVAINRSVKPTADDITQTVGTLVDAEPDALVVLTGPEQATLAATSAQAADFTGNLYLDANAAGDLFIPQTAAAGMNDATMIFTQILAIDDVIATTPAKAARKQWFRDYTSEYGSYNGAASFAADAARLIGEGVAAVGPDRERLRTRLETSQVDGLSGPIRITPDNHSGLMPQALTVLVARNGRWRLAS